MKKTIVISLILTFISSFFFFIPVGRFFIESTQYYKKSRLEFINYETLHTFDMSSKNSKEIYSVEIGPMSKIYVVKDFDNIDSLETIITVDYSSTIMEEI